MGREARLKKNANRNQSAAAQAKVIRRRFDQSIDDAVQLFQEYARDHQPQQKASFERAIREIVAQAQSVQEIVGKDGTDNLPFDPTTPVLLRRAAGGEFSPDSRSDFREVEDDVLPLIFPSSIPSAEENRRRCKVAFADQPKPNSLDTAASVALQAAEITWASGQPEPKQISALVDGFKTMCKSQLAYRGHGPRIGDSSAIVVAADFSRTTIASMYAHELSEVVLLAAYPAWEKATMASGLSTSTDWIAAGIECLVWAVRNRYQSVEDLKGYEDPHDSDVWTVCFEIFNEMFAEDSEPTEQEADERLLRGIEKVERAYAQRVKTKIEHCAARGVLIENATSDLKPYLVGAGLAGLVWRHAQRLVSVGDADARLKASFEVAGAFFTAIILAGPNHSREELIGLGLAAMRPAAPITISAL